MTGTLSVRHCRFAGENIKTFLDRQGCAFLKLLLIGAADRMLNGDERIAIRTEYARHKLCRTHKLRRHYADGRQSEALTDDGVMQTARRTAASIPDPGNQGLPLFRFL